MTEKLRIHQTKVYLSLNADVSRSNNQMSSHKCLDCNYKLDAAEFGVFDELPTLEDSVCTESKSNLVYIAGYVIRRDQESEAEDSHNYFEKYGNYSELLNRGGLSTPGDRTCQWTIFSFIMSEMIKHKVCRTSLSRVLNEISDVYGFEVPHTHSRVLANIFINNHCKVSSPLQGKEYKQKIIKLS